MKNPWDKYPIANSASVKGGNPWDKYPVANTSPQSKEQNPLLSARGAARSAKSIGSGAAGGAVDTVTLPYNIAATMFNALKNSEFSKNLDPASRAMLEAEGFSFGEPGSPDIPLIPSATDAIDKGVDKLTNDYTKTPENEKSFHEGLKGAASMGSVGGIAKGLVKFGANKVGNALGKFGSTKLRDIAAGFGASGITDYALEKGHSLPAAFGEGIGTGLAIETILKKKLPSRASMLALGLNKKKLKTDVLDAANRQGIDLPAAAATDSKLMSLANQFVSASPIMGDIVREKAKTASQAFQKGFQELADSIGPLKNEAVEQEINHLYAKVRDSLPKDAKIVPHHTVDAIKQVKDKIKTAVLSPTEKELLTNLDTLSNNLMFDNKLAVPMPVEMLVGTKRSLNSIIKWDKDEGTKNLLKTVQQATLKDIEAYGEINPIWKKTFDEAERNFEKVAKRQKLENILSTKIQDPITKEVASIPLAKLLNNPKYSNQLKNIVGEQHLKKLEDFTKVAEAMAVAQKNIPNPSGSAIVGSISALIYSLINGNIMTPSFAVGGGAYLTRLLTSKKFLNLATKFAKEPSEPLAQTLNAIIKENTGMTTQTLLAALRNQTND